MAAENQDVTLRIGDSLEIWIRLRKPDGTPADITPGATARWWMGKRVGAVGDEVYIKKNSENSGELTIDLSLDYPYLVVHLSPEDSAELKASTRDHPYYHEAKVFDSGVETHTTTGAFTLLSVLIPHPADA